MKKKIVPIIIVVIAVVAAFCVYYFVLKPALEEGAETEAATLEDMYYYIPGEYFVTNINGSDALCKTSVALALTGDDQTTLLEKNNAVIRNVIIKVLISHAEDDMRGAQVIDMLEGEMTSAVKAALDTEELQNVYISDFVIQ